MNNIKGKFYFIILAFVLVLASCSQNQSPSTSETPKAASPNPTSEATSTPKNVPSELKFGVLLPLTGTFAPVGEDLISGIKLAVEHYNKNGGIEGMKLVPVYEDSQFNPRLGVTGFQKLVAADKVPAIITGATTIIMATNQLAEESHVIHINPGAQGPILRGTSKYLFNTIELADFHSEVIAKYAYNELGYKKIAVLNSNNDTGNSISDKFIEKYTALDGEIVKREKYDDSTQNFSSQLSKIRQSSMEAIYIAPTTAEDGTRLLKQAKEMGIAVPLLGSAVFDQETWKKISVEAVEGLIYTSSFFDKNANDPIVKQYVEDYKAQYKKDPFFYTGTSYDAVVVIAEAARDVIKSGGIITGDSLKDAINKIRSFGGVTGGLKFNDDGTVTKPIILKQIKKGERIELKVIQP